MATQRYITAQLIDITLSGELGNLSRNTVRGFIAGAEGLSLGIFAGADIVSETTYNTVDTSWYDIDRTNAAEALTEVTTITLTDAVFKIPTSLFSSANITEEAATTALSNWIELIQSGAEPYVDVAEKEAEVNA
jgi:hypothetical protein